MILNWQRVTHIVSKILLPSVFSIAILQLKLYFLELIAEKQQNHSLSSILTQLWKLYLLPFGSRVAQWVRSIDITAHQYCVDSRPALHITKIGALDYRPQVIKFTSCFPSVGGYLCVLRLPPPKRGRHDIAKKIAESGVKHNNSNQSNVCNTDVVVCIIFVI